MKVKIIVKIELSSTFLCEASGINV